VRCFILNDHISREDNRPTDDELIERFISGDDYAFEAIASRYLGLIASAGSRCRGLTPDIDSGDLIQEGMLALLSACRSYDPDGGMNFKNYLMLCVDHRYKSLQRRAMRKSAVPAHSLVSIEDEENSAVDPTLSTLPELVESKEYVDHLHRILRNRLSDLEYRVAILHLSGYSYKEISDELDLPLKTIDNAQTRIRQKLSR